MRWDDAVALGWKISESVSHNVEELGVEIVSWE